LLIEGVILPSQETTSTKLTAIELLDIEMLVMEGGLERTEAEFRALFDVAGIRLTNIVPTPSPMSVIEGVPM
jgi:hypothetical protein